MHGTGNVVDGENGPHPQEHPEPGPDTPVGRHRRPDPYWGRHRPYDDGTWSPVPGLPRRAIAVTAAAIFLGLGSVPFVSRGEGAAWDSSDALVTAAVLEERATGAREASRSASRTGSSPAPIDPEAATGALDPAPTGALDPAPTGALDPAPFEDPGRTPTRDTEQTGSDQEQADDAARTASTTKETGKDTAEQQESAAKKAAPKPVGGLSQRQMDHAAVIVEVGRAAGLPKRAYVIAIATALQESYLRNLANDTMPESFNHPNDGSGWDHDSVGLFQQRPSAGWGTVAQLMDPAYAAGQFYSALRQVPGWQGLPVTVAAQRVQVSAFPDAYAKHEGLATRIVNALMD